MTKKTHKTREGWLVAATEALDKKFFAENGYKLPKRLQVSCGFPRGVSRAIGQCWDPQVSRDGTTQMFVCPSLGDVIKVMDVLLHEMIHASVGLECGHRGVFRKLAKEFGLAGKMTATFAEEGSDLHKQLTVLAWGLGKYPHAPMNKKMKKGTGGSGWIRFKSLKEDTFRVLASPRLVEEHGLPRDPWGEEMVPVS